VNVGNVSREDWIIGGLSVLLIIDLVFLPWFDSGVSGPICNVVTCSVTATGDPDGWLGVLAVLALILVLVDLAMDRFSPQTNLPAINGSRTHTRFVLAGAAAVFLGFKFLFNIHFSIFGFGFWAAVVLTIPLVYFTLQARNTDLGLGRRA
jgi:MYXO-CTERM domain-containing protein